MADTPATQKLLDLAKSRFGPISPAEEKLFKATEKGGAGLGAVFLVSMLVVLCAAAIALPLLNAPSLDGAAEQHYRA